MKKLLNVLFSFLKYILLLAAFGSTLFVVLKLYTRLEKDITQSLNVFLPYFVLLVMFVISFCLNREYVRKNIFFNITCCLVFGTNLVVIYRAIFDTNMLFNSIQKMGVNFNYFNDYLAFNNIMLYGLAVSNLVFMFIPNDMAAYKSVKKVKISNNKSDKKGKKVISKKDEQPVVQIINDEEKGNHKDTRNVINIIQEEEKESNLGEDDVVTKEISDDEVI